MSTPVQIINYPAHEEPVGIHPLYHPSATGRDMPEFYHIRDGKRIERVPRQPLHSPHRETFPGILFFTIGWPGVRVKEILEDKVTIDSPEDLVLAEHGWRQTVVNLEWPGFVQTSSSNPMSARINVCQGENGLTRLQFAREICSLFWKFFHDHSKRPLVPGYEKWCLNSKSIRLKDVVLLSVHYYRNVWVPEFYIIQRET